VPDHDQRRVLIQDGIGDTGHHVVRFDHARPRSEVLGHHDVLLDHVALVGGPSVQATWWRNHRRHQLAA
jgi:hypothetical protein